MFKSSGSVARKDARANCRIPGILLLAVLVLSAPPAPACFYHSRGLNTSENEQTTLADLMGSAFDPDERKREREHYQREMVRLQKEYASRQDDPDWLDEFAAVLYRNGREVEAAQIWTRLLKKDPDRFVTLCNFATALQMRGRPGDAIRLLKKAVDLRPDFRHGAEQWHLRLLEFQQRQRENPGLALNSLFIEELTPLWTARKGAADLPEFPISVTSQGLIEMLREHPTFGDGWLVLAMAFENEGKLSEAQICYERALKRGTTQKARIEAFLPEFREKVRREDPSRKTARGLLITLGAFCLGGVALFFQRYGGQMVEDYRLGRASRKVHPGKEKR